MPIEPTACSARPALYYDGGCPVCSREIAMYQRQPGAEGVEWIDVSRCDAPALGPGLDRQAALARLHLRRADGELVSGARAFVGLWASLPRWAPLARIAGLRPVLWVLETGYRGFLVARRTWRRAA